MRGADFCTKCKIAKGKPSGFPAPTPRKSRAQEGKKELQRSRKQTRKMRGADFCTKCKIAKGKPSGFPAPTPRKSRVQEGKKELQRGRKRIDKMRGGGYNYIKRGNLYRIAGFPVKNCNFLGGRKQ